MTEKNANGLGMPWEADYGYAQAVRTGDTIYGSEKPEVASTILVTPRLALPGQLIEVKFIAKV